jgi:hypothetical protein
MRANLFLEKVLKKFTVKKDPGIRERENPGIHIPADLPILYHHATQIMSGL